MYVHIYIYAWIFVIICIWIYWYCRLYTHWNLLNHCLISTCFNECICVLECLVHFPYIEFGWPRCSPVPLRWLSHWFPHHSHHSKGTLWVMSGKTMVFEATRFTIYTGKCWRNVSWNPIHHDPRHHGMSSYTLQVQWCILYNSSTSVPMGAMVKHHMDPYGP